MRRRLRGDCMRNIRHACHVNEAKFIHYTRYEGQREINHTSLKAFEYLISMRNSKHIRSVDAKKI